MKAIKTASKTHENGAAASNPWAFAADQGRQQMSVATESACAMFRGFEAIRKIQERAAHEALQRHQAALGRIGQCQPADLMNLQSGLLQSDLQGAAKYWQELGAAAMEMQTEMASCGSHLVDSDSVLEAASSVDHWPFFANALGLRQVKAGRAHAA